MSWVHYNLHTHRALPQAGLNISAKPELTARRAAGAAGRAGPARPSRGGRSHLLGREAVLPVQLRREGHQLLLCEVPARLSQHLVRFWQLHALVHGVQPAEAPEGQRWEGKERRAAGSLQARGRGPRQGSCPPRGTLFPQHRDRGVRERSRGSAGRGLG